MALGRPTPHDIPAAVVGHLARQPGVIPALEAATGNSVRLTSYASLARAEHAISEQRIYAALALTGGRPRLLVASAAGISVARVLVQAAQAVPARAGGPVQIVDLHPLPPTDPQGLASFYATLAATILGFVTMFQLRANAESLSLRVWLVCIVVLAFVGGLVLALITDPLLQALRGRSRSCGRRSVVQLTCAPPNNAFVPARQRPITTGIAGTTPTSACGHARAVYAALRVVVPRNEIGDVESELPRECAPLFSVVT